MARVYKRKGYKGPNKWWIDYKDCDGIRHREPAAPNKETAETLLAAELVARGEGRRLSIKENPSITCEKLSDHYMMAYAKQHKDSWKDDRSKLRYILPTVVNGVPFGRHLAPKVKPMDIAAVIDSLKTELVKGKIRTLATLNRYRTLLEGMFTFAIANKFATENPVKSVPKFTEKKAKTNFADTNLWLAFLRLASDWMRPIIQLAGWTGMREGELLAIKIEDINLDLNLVNIPDNKEEDVEKQVSLSDDAVELIRELLQKPRPTDCPYLFYVTATTRDKDGQLLAGPAYSATSKWFKVNPVSGNGRFRREWNALRLAVGAPTFKFHWFRHTCGSHMAMNGAPLKDIQNQLNHSRSSTSERYIHLTQAHMVRSVNRARVSLPNGTHVAQNGFSVVEPDLVKDETVRQYEAKS